MSRGDSGAGASGAGAIAKKVGKYLGLAGLAYVAIFAAYSIFQFGSTKSKLLQFGMSASTSQLLAIAVMLIAIALPLMAAVRILVMRGRVFDYAAVMVLPLISWGIQQIPAKFSATTGEALKFCAKRPGGEEFCLDHEGFDPLTGIKLQPVTAGAVLDDYRRSQGLLPQRITAPFDEIQFFDTLDGSPRVWVWPGADGCFEAFDNSGVHPVEGAQLLPVTRELIAGMRQCLEKKDERAASARAERIAAERQAAEEQAAREAAAQRQKQRAELAAYRDRYTSRQGPRARYALAVSNGSGIDSSATTRLIRLMPGSRADAVLRDASVPDGVFDRMYSGGQDEFQKLAMAELADQVVLAKIDVGYRENDAIRGTTNARVALALRVLDSRSGSTIKSVSKSASALGYDKHEAYLAALGELLNGAAAEL